METSLFIRICVLLPLLVIPIWFLLRLRERYRR